LVLLRLRGKLVVASPKELKVGKTLTGNQKLDYHFLTGMKVGATVDNDGILAVLWMDNASITTQKKRRTKLNAAETTTREMEPKEKRSNPKSRVKECYGQGKSRAIQSSGHEEKSIKR